MMPAHGHVIIQPKKMTANIPQFTEATEPLHKPTQNVDPVMQWVVDTGMPTREAIMTVNMAPSSMQ